VRAFLELLAARVATPGAGGAAAITGALAAGLVAMAARFSDEQLPAAADLAREADRLRERAATLTDRDAVAYRAVLDAYRLPGEGDGGERRDEIAAAFDGAATTPLEIAEIAARVAELAALVAARGNPNLRGETIAAAHLAEASARSAAALVEINVALCSLPGNRSRRAANAVDTATAAVARASAAQADASAARERRGREL
jgi:methenyltetrahydrofolate cyclohydrolase